MQTKFAALSALCLSLGLTSCFQSEQKSIVNSDGSCSFTVEQSMNVAAMKGMASQFSKGALKMDEKADPAAQAKEQRDAIVSMMSKAKGVDVWSEASSSVDASGKTVTKVSGYAKDLSKLKMMEDASSQGDGGPAELGGFATFETSKDADGNFVLEVPVEKLIAKSSDKAGTDVKPKLSAEERKQKRKEQAQQMSMMMGMMGAMLKDAKITYLFNFGQGTVIDHGCFKLVNPNTVSLEMKVLDMITGMQKLSEDEEMATIIEDGAHYDAKNPAHQKVMAAMLETMYGKGGKPRVVVKMKANAFDYDAAVTKAKAGQSTELKSLIQEAEAKAKEPKAEPFGLKP